MGEIELRLPPDAAFVGLARLVVITAARKAGMAGERVEDLKIAVSEAATNAIRVRTRGGKDDPVVIRFGRTGQSFAVTVADADPEAARGARDRDRPPGMDSGLGLQLIEGLADAVAYERARGVDLRMSFSVAAIEDNGRPDGR
jgi:serine/threonine-protein kinase RsbW